MKENKQNTIWFNILKHLILFLIGGFIYTSIELLWRSRTHWTMFIVGGVCFIMIGLINEVFTYDMSIIRQMALSAILVTLVELFVGLIINPHYGIWDYRNMPLNIMGQVCLPFSILWFLLSFVAIVLDDVLRWKLFGEEKPHYVLFSKNDN